MIAVSFALFCLGAFGSAAAHHCPNDWVAFEHSCYVFLDIKVPWTSAKAFCELLGAKMLEVESKAENDFIVAQMSRSGLSRVWMGINDLVREARWVYNSNGLPLKYSNWLSAKFDNSQAYEGGEDCGEIFSNGGWNDLWCERYYQQTTPVCEKREVHG
ncbi:asialoglycoprotein receptor 2-like isoform X2 [Littorina saxatilis]|uniref:asialoglycoprotein receptor 2-like isoform X2 n=1 Tax=Littorina saxatilis TaxID=31220 RepID=UPI0038B67F12